MPCSFQVGPRWTKPKVDSTGRLIWSFILCAEVEAIDHCLHSPAILEGSSKGWVYSVLIYPCLSFQKGAQYMQAYVTSNIPTWKRLPFPHIVVGGKNETLLKFCIFGKKKKHYWYSNFQSIMKIIEWTRFLLWGDIVLSCAELPSFNHGLIGNTDSYRLEL